MKGGKVTWMRSIPASAALYLALAFAAQGQGIVNNAGSSSEDSVSVLVLSLDSLGRPTSADSFFVVVCKSSDNGALFRDSGTAALTGLDTTTLAGQRYYYYHRATADLDGSGAPGWYSGVVTAKKNAGGLLTPNRFSFQIVEQELSDALDSIGRAAVNSARALDSLGMLHNALDGLEAGGCSGSGGYAVSIVVRDSVHGMVVPGAEVAVRNLAQTALVAVGLTDPAGRVQFNLDSARYLAVVQAPGYLFAPFDTITISGAMTDTVAGYRFDPGSPSVAMLCRVYGYLYDLSGTPERNATVSASLPGGVARSGDLVISPVMVSCSTDSAGYFFLDVIPSDSLTSGGTKYEFTISRQNGAIFRQRLKVPATSSWRLTW
jgi:hypothetical protein